MYLAAGKQKYERGNNSIQYCGITEGNFSSRFRNHHKLPLITREREFWLGTVVVPANASRYYLEIAEALIIYFWQPSLNEKKKIYTFAYFPIQDDFNEPGLMWAIKLLVGEKRF